MIDFYIKEIFLKLYYVYQTSQDSKLQLSLDYDIPAPQLKDFQIDLNFSMHDFLVLSDLGAFAEKDSNTAWLN